MLRLTGELSQPGTEVRAHAPAGLLHMLQMRAGEYQVPYLMANQVGKN